MNIVFLTRLEPRNIKNWSGTLYYIYGKLKEKHKVEIIGTEIIYQLASFSDQNFSTDTFIQVDRYLTKLNRLLSERINSLNFDLVFYGDLFFLPVDFNIPMIILSDITFELVKIHHTKPDERNIDPCIILEKLLYENSFKIIYPSEWIKNRVKEIYHINPNKINVVEFGANIPAPQNYSININIDVCRLVFIGINWERKGGDKILQAYKQLKNEGFPCTLTIIGSMPGEGQEDDKNLNIIPFLDKTKQEDLQKLFNILSESHFLVLPTQFDAFGIVFCEASAYGVPSIASDVGGVSQAIKEGKNGFLLPADATASDYAEKIKNVFNDKENYIKLRQSSRNEFETRLNWDVWGEKVNIILEDAVEEWKGISG